MTLWPYLFHQCPNDTTTSLRDSIYFVFPNRHYARPRQAAPEANKMKIGCSLDHHKTESCKMLNINQWHKIILKEDIQKLARLSRGQMRRQETRELRWKQDSAQKSTGRLALAEDSSCLNGKASAITLLIPHITEQCYELLSPPGNHLHKVCLMIYLQEIDCRYVNLTQIKNQPCVS